MYITVIVECILASARLKTLRLASCNFLPMEKIVTSGFWSWTLEVVLKGSAQSGRCSLPPSFVFTQNGSGDLS